MVEAEIVVEEVEMEKKKRRLDDNEELDYKRKYFEVLARLNETKREGTFKKIKGNSVAKIKKKSKKTKASVKEDTSKSGEKNKDKNKKPTTKKIIDDAGTSTDTITDDDEDLDMIVKILNRRERGGKVELEIKWSDGVREWTLEENVKQDAPGLYNKFQEQKIPAVKVVKTSKKPATIRFKCKKTHTCFSMLNFKTEDNIYYWKEDNRMYNVKCKGCNGSFLSDGLKPTASAPAYVCVNECRGCKVSYCNKCFLDGMLKNINDSGATRRSTRVVAL